jgi:gluconolactonase
MRRVLLVLAVGCGGDDPPGRPADAADGNPLAGIGAVELIAPGTTFEFTEGPQWREAEQLLVFTDIPADTIYSCTIDGTIAVLRRPSNNANGLALDGGGALLAAEHGSRSVTRDGTAIASMFEGMRLNSPNDLVVAADGTIYFTDPPFGINDNERELDFMGVFRFANGMLTAEHRGTLAERPNGIGLSPDGATLYVADSAAAGLVYAHPVMAGGALGARRNYAQTSGTADGLAVDAAGNVFVSARDGVEVFAPDGTKWGTIEVPAQPANVAFGDPDHKTLYITARTSLFKVRLANAGLPNN